MKIFVLGQVSTLAGHKLRIRGLRKNKRLAKKLEELHGTVLLTGRLHVVDTSHEIFYITAMKTPDDQYSR